MPTIISGDGTITGLTATGISAVQNVGSANLPAGTVLQVVNGSTGTTVATALDSNVDTGLTATITPKFSTSKILVLAQQNGLAKSGNNYMQLQLFRNASPIATFGNALGYTNTSEQLRYGGAGMGYLDSPSTTSATTYKTMFNSQTAGSSVTVQDNSGLSTITLLEIAV